MPYNILDETKVGHLQLLLGHLMNGATLFSKYSLAVERRIQTLSLAQLREKAQTIVSSCWFNIS